MTITQSHTISIWDLTASAKDFADEKVDFLAQEFIFGTQADVVFGKAGVLFAESL